MLNPAGSRSAFVARNGQSKIASPWVRVVAGAQRGQCFRDCGAGRVWARGELEKVAVDLELRAAGFRLLSAPSGSTIE